MEFYHLLHFALVNQIVFDGNKQIYTCWWGTNSADFKIGKFDDKEILGTEIEISIGLALGESSINFVGGERKRAEFLILGETRTVQQILLGQMSNFEK